MSSKILLVEDNKTLAKLLSRKIEMALDFRVDIAGSLAEAKVLCRDPKSYFIALLDLNLPDAPNGEVVDEVLKHGIPSIVLTGSNDPQTREAIMAKNIVDYVYKGGMQDVQTIFDTIHRLTKNRQFKILIVDDSLAVRNEMKRILASQFYTVLVAAHGEEALSYFQDNPDIKLVLTDYYMPVIDGLTLTRKLREMYSKDELGIIALTASDDKSIATQFLKSGANDFLTKPFNHEEIICRVDNIISLLDYIQTISNMANVDPLTNAYNRRYFYKEAPKYIEYARTEDEPYAVMMIDIDNFKTLNDSFGHAAGDEVLKNVAKILKDNSKGSDFVVRMGGDELLALLRNISFDDAVTLANKICWSAAGTTLTFNQRELSYTISIGVAPSAENLEVALDNADMALYHAKNKGRNRVEQFS